MLLHLRLRYAHVCYVCYPLVYHYVVTFARLPGYHTFTFTLVGYVAVWLRLHVPRCYLRLRLPLLRFTFYIYPFTFTHGLHGLPHVTRLRLLRLRYVTFDLVWFVYGSRLRALRLLQHRLRYVYAGCVTCGLRLRCGWFAFGWLLRLRCYVWLRYVWFGLLVVTFTFTLLLFDCC